MAGFFSRLKGKDGPAKVKKGAQQPIVEAPVKPRWEDAWTRKTVEPEEVQELLRGCTVELKSRALDMPFLLLPFRPTSDPSAARSFIRNFFDRGQRVHGQELLQELRLTEPMVLCSVVKWCWSRLPSGVVGWEIYELFKQFEKDSDWSRSAFPRFILTLEQTAGTARTEIIKDFFNLLSAIAAHGKSNGLGGRKLSRYAAWWAFEYTDDGDGFEGGYKKWAAAADATSHLFFAYLRSQDPDAKGLSAISSIPMSLQKLVQESEYPPERPSLLQSSTLKVVMIVDAVSPTPFSLLRRANHFQYRDEDRALQEFADYEDPVKALTDECRRVLRSISSANQSEASSSKHSTGLTDASWSRFEDMGFSGGFDEAEEEDEESSFARKKTIQGLRTTPLSKNNGLAGNRPTTPSWADFLSSGFVDEAGNEPRPLLLPPDKILPPIDTRGRSSQSHRPRLETNQLEPGELASITRFDLDDSFWWVWISSLAGEEPSERKAAFGRCALVETIIRGGKWLVMEEMVKGAAPEPEAGAYIAEKKSFWGRSKKNKTTLARRMSTAEPSALRPTLKPNASMGGSTTSIGPVQQAKMREAALRLKREQQQEHEAAQESVRRGRNDVDMASMKTSSVYTLQTVMVNDASPAMKWANKYDKDAIREAYLGSNTAGLGRGLGEATMQSNGNKSQDTLKPLQNLERSVSTDKELPPMPSPKPVPRSHTPSPPAAQEVEEPQFPEQADEYIQPQSPLEAHPIDRQGAQTSMSKVMSKVQSRVQPTPEPRESMDYAGSSPDDKKHKKLKKKEPSTGGFRKMFGRKNRDASAKPPQAHNGGLPSNGGGLGRKLSNFRNKSITSAPPTPVVSPPADIQRFSEDEVTPVHSPNQAYEHEYDPSIQDSLSRVDTNDAQEADHAFSSFDQGPLEDVPAFVPEDSPRNSEDFYDAAPADIARSRSGGDGAELTQQVSPVQDRWAQIRKNAAENAAKRAKAAESDPSRQSEDQSRGGYSQKTNGDDETSEEETIESRVARIKARVAELTGNMETTGGSPKPAARPSRRA